MTRTLACLPGTLGRGDGMALAMGWQLLAFQMASPPTRGVTNSLGG